MSIWRCQPYAILTCTPDVQLAMAASGDDVMVDVVGRSELTTDYESRGDSDIESESPE